ncbi:efflux RND transporter periplasmic adaptor subunit [Azonexus hydrophilus]|jgi:RND family efflux transporter MFP subunit|uniref:Efflux RND transporter periplasmic adaptor subunit n=1 Tax=Azonexus hydrophilus TaxID=418702 RepID=A0ABZ2XJR4_9RHOO|nr:efflux RND transporter periplasmic adaptor subunit [Dechloromonas sp.]
MSRHFLIKPYAVSLFLCLLSLEGHAAETTLLNARQLQSLGIQTRTLPPEEDVRLPGLPGRVDIPAGQLQMLVAPLEGTLQEVLIPPGEMVKKGQVVARLISPQALELQRLHVEASARAAQAGAARQRDEQLFKEGIIAQARLESSRAAAAEAGAQLAQSRQSLALAGGRPGAGGAVLELRAGLDGVLLEQLAQVGDRLPAATPIARIGRPAPLWVTLQVPAGVAARVKAGDIVRLPLLGVEGKLLAVSRSVDAASQNVTLRAQVDRGSEQLRPGQAVEVEIQVSGQPGQALPSRALARHEGQLLAFVQQGGGETVRFVAKPVKVLSQLGDTVMVAGLVPGERVAVQGVASLKAMLAGAGGE